MGGAWGGVGWAKAGSPLRTQRALRKTKGRMRRARMGACARETSSATFVRPSGEYVKGAACLRVAQGQLRWLVVVVQLAEARVAAFVDGAETREYLGAIDAGRERGALLQWGIEHLAQARIIGTTTLFHIDRDQGRAEIKHQIL